MEVAGLVFGALSLVEPALNRLKSLAERVKYSQSLREDIIRHISTCTEMELALTNVWKIVQSEDVQLLVEVDSALRQRLKSMTASLRIVEDDLKAFEARIPDMSSARAVKKALHTAKRFWKSKKVHEALEKIGEELNELRALCDNVLLAFIARAPYAATTSGSSAADGFKPSFSVLPNTKALAFNFDLSNADVAPLTSEAQLKAALDSNNTAVAVGHGGEGKTCALREIANMPDVQAKFRDGVYFLELGSDATVKTVIEKLKLQVILSGGSATAKKLEIVTDLEEAVAIAATWFHGHTCLFVVDDIWPGNKIPENVVGVLSKLCYGSIGKDRSKMLCSTRNKEVVTYGKAVEFNAKDRTLAESQEMLLMAAGARVSVLEDADVLEAVQKILSVCQGLPLMLNIAGSMVAKMSAERNGPQCPWRAYAHKLLTEAGDELEHTVRGERPVGRSIQTSLDFLDENYRDDLRGSNCSSYTDVLESLCVLQKQDLVPFNILSRLWSVASKDVRTVADRLEGVSLIEITEQRAPSGESMISSVHTHHLIHNYALLKGRENGSLCVWPNRIVQSFEQELSEQVGGDCWPSLLPHDGYILRNFCRLLLMSGRTSLAGSVLRSARWAKRMLQMRDILQLEQDGAAFCESQFANEAERDAVTIMARIARLSLPFYAESDQSIWFQFNGRLLAIESDASKASWVRDVIAEVVRNSKKPWLRPLNACLSSPTSPIIAIFRYIAGGTFHVTSVKYLDGGRVIYCGCSSTVFFLSKAELSGKISNIRLDVTQELCELEEINCVALSSDGCRIVTGSNNGAVRIWNSSTGQAIVPKPHGHTKSVQCLAMSADGARVASASWDMTVRVWDVENGTEVCAPRTGHTGAVFSLSMSADGARVASGSWDMTVRVWDVERGTDVCTKLTGHTGAVFSVSMSADGARVASGSRDNTVRAWDVERGTEVCTKLTGHTGAVLSVSMSRDGMRVASGSSDKTVRAWEVECGREVCAPLTGHSGVLRCVSISTDGTRVASWSDDKTVRVWDVERGRDVCAPLTGHAGVVPSASMSADGTRVTSWSDDKTVRVRGVERGREVCTPLTGHADAVLSTAMSADGARVASGSADKTVRVWDVDRGREVCAPLTGHTGAVLSVSLSRDGSRVASWSSDKTVRVWDVECGREVCAPLTGQAGAVLSSAMSTDGRRVASGSADKTVRVWDVDRGREVCAPLTGHTGAVLSVSMSADGARVASGSSDMTVRVWDVERHTEVCTTLNGHARAVLSVSMSADGAWVVSESSDKIVRVWDVLHGTCTREVACRDRVWHRVCPDTFHLVCKEEFGEGEHGGAYEEAVFKAGGDGGAEIVRSAGGTSAVMARLEQGVEELFVSAQTRTVVVTSDKHVAFFKIEE